MHIVVCVEQVPDVHGPLRLYGEVASLENEHLVPIANPSDLTALALAREVVPREQARVTVLTIGPQNVEKVLKACLALGADDAIRVWGTRVDVSDSAAVARILACAVRSLDPDLVLCGASGLGSNLGYVGPAIAEHLHLPQVCGITSLEIAKDHSAVTVERKLDRGDREIVHCPIPAVLTVEDGVIEVPYASLPALIRAASEEIPVKDPFDLGFSAVNRNKSSNGRLLGYQPPRPRTKKVEQSIDASSPFAAMQQMMGGATSSSSDVVEGKPKQVAIRILEFIGID